MGSFFTLWLLVILAVGFYDLKYSIALYIPYLILVPFDLSKIPSNYISILLLLIFYFIYRKKKKFKGAGKPDWRPLIPFAVYFLFHLLLIPFQNEVPFGLAFQRIRSGAINLIILPFIMWNTAIRDRTSISIYRYVFIICVVIAGLYGLALTQLVGINPYLMWMYDLAGVELNEAYLDSENTGRLFGRISSVFYHPMTFGLFLGFAFIYVYSCRNKINKYLMWSLMLVILINIMVCGVRSVIAATFLAALYYLILNRNFKLMVSASIVGVLLVLVLSMIPEMSSYLASITDVQNKNADVTGSSLDMRINQFFGCINEIKNCFMVGHGYTWTGLYMDKYVVHPVCLCFESLIFVVICNSGMLGCIFWIYYVRKIYKNNIYFLKKKHIIVNSVLVFYLTYSCITGEYNYMPMFVITYMLTLCNNIDSIHPKYLRQINHVNKAKVKDNVVVGKKRIQNNNSLEKQ